jgi:hypothetical protein
VEKKTNFSFNVFDFKRMGFYSKHEVWTQRGNLGSGDAEGSTNLMNTM